VSLMIAVVCLFHPLCWAHFLAVISLSEGFQVTMTISFFCRRACVCCFEPNYGNKKVRVFQLILNSYSRVSLLQLTHCLKSVRPYFKQFCRSMITCHKQTLPVFLNIFTSRRIVLFGTYLSAYALLNASRTAAM
jgi:hypothetical protein